MGTGDGTLNYRGTRDITSTIVRLKRGVTIEQAGAEVEALSRQLEATHPETNRGVAARVTPIWKRRVGAQCLLMEPLRILMVVCVLLLLVVCANVAQISRNIHRRHQRRERVAHPHHRQQRAATIAAIWSICSPTIISSVTERRSRYSRMGSPNYLPTGRNLSSAPKAPRGSAVLD